MLFAVTFLVGGFFISNTAFAVETTAIVYDAIPNPLLPNMGSLGFHATQTAEFGDYIHLGGTNRILNTITVTMSDWALNSDYPLMDIAGWTHPITLNIYNAVPGTPLNTKGSLIGTVTQTFTIPWRPEGDQSCPIVYGVKGWKAGDSCYNGYAFNITFDLSSLNVTMPDDVIVGVAYNTQSYGVASIGVSGPYNSLNVGEEGSATIGADKDLDNVFWNTSTAASYTDKGDAGVGIFREDTAWGKPSYTLAAGTLPMQITATPVPVTSPSLGVAETYGIVSKTYTNSLNTGPETAIVGKVCYTTGPATAPVSISGATETPCPSAVEDAQTLALTDLNTQATASCITVPNNLNEYNTTGVFTTGCYKTTGAMNITASTTVTLSGPGTFIFKSAEALTTGDNSRVVLTAGASAENVFWIPVGGTTIGANATTSATPTFVGSIFRGVAEGLSITLGHFAHLEGRALAFGSTVTTDSNTITVPGVVATFALTYSAGTNGTLTGTASQTVNYGADGTLVTATPAVGYHFVTWDDGVLTAARTETNVTATHSPTATFAVNSYTLTFNSAGGSTVTAITQNYGTSVTTPTAPTKEGYTFSAWSPVVPETMGLDQTLTAQWTAIPQHHTSGSSPRTTIVAVNTPIVITPAPVGQVLGAEAYNFTLLIKNNSKGNEVIELQKYLIANGYLTGIADGSFGPKTLEGVKKFQNANSLVADGIVGPDAREILNKALVTPATPAIPADGNGTPATPAVPADGSGAVSLTYNFGTTNLKNGSHGDAVQELQRFLNNILGLGLVVDGKLGPKTIAVIKQWQGDNGLDADGIIGLKTKALMNSTFK